MNKEYKKCNLVKMFNTQDFYITFPLAAIEKLKKDNLSIVVQFEFEDAHPSIGIFVPDHIHKEFPSINQFFESLVQYHRLGDFFESMYKWDKEFNE